jgi:hypothetical protein
VRRLRSYLRRRARALIKMRRFQFFTRTVTPLGDKLGIVSTAQDPHSGPVAVVRQSAAVTAKRTVGAINFVTTGARQICRARQAASIGARINRHE